MAADPFKGWPDGPQFPSRRFYTVGPADGADLPIIPKALICSAAGNLQLVGDDGTAVQVAVNANVVYPLAPQRIKLTGHTAGTVIALC